jgi:hypothetical protein
MPSIYRIAGYNGKHTMKNKAGLPAFRGFLKDGSRDFTWTKEQGTGSQFVCHFLTFSFYGLLPGITFSLLSSGYSPDYQNDND